MAANDGEDDWGADFFQELLKAEDLALSSVTQLPKPQPPPRPAVVTSLPPVPTRNKAAYSSGPSFAYRTVNDISYSPPREMSQRPPEFSSGAFAPPIYDTSNNTAQELEIERLKAELERVSKKLNGMEEECTELRRERDEQDKQLKSAPSDAKKAENKSLMIETSGRKSEFLVGNHPGASSHCQNGKTITEGAGQPKSKACQAIGVQTDYDGGLHSTDVKEDSHTFYFLQKNLQSIWSQSSGHRSRSFITNLLVTCSTDFCDLFGYLGKNISTRTADSLARELSDCLASESCINASHSAQSTSRYNLCSVLAKIRDGMVQVDALLDILLDLCSTDNVLVIHKSLCILHAALAILATTERRDGRRENIKIEGLHPERVVIDQNDSKCDAISKLRGKMLMDLTHLDKKGQWCHSSTLLSQVNFVHIFQKMCIIVLKSEYKQVQLEAVFIMKAILVRTNGLSEREEYGEPKVFEAVAHLLRKEAGLSLRSEAVRILHLLLNCPELLAKYCVSWKDLKNPAEATDGAKYIVFQVSHAILQGLADCIIQYGNDAQDINLRRSAMDVLSFLSNPGASAFEIVLSHKLPNGVNFLGLILRVLASDIDAEASESKPSLDILKERILFMREALILLNRLASNPTTSTKALQVLASNRDMVSLTVDVAARLSRECRQLRASDETDATELAEVFKRRSEVTDLARVFKRRVFSYLGESCSS